MRASHTDPTIISDMSSHSAYSQNLPRRDKIVRPNREFSSVSDAKQVPERTNQSALPTTELTGSYKTG
jgi:hypothetical protein